MGHLRVTIGGGIMRTVTVAHVLASRIVKGGEQFLLAPQRNWKFDGRPMLAPLTKKLLPGDDSLARTIEATEREGFDGDAPEVLRRRVLPAVGLTLRSPARDELTAYQIIPVVARYHRGTHERRAERLGGRWMTRTEALREAALSPTARAVIERLRCGPAGPLDPASLVGSWTERLVFARDRDRRAFGPLFEEMRGRLEAGLRARFASPQDVEDVLAETALFGLAHLDDFDERFTALAWLGTIARNQEIAVLRQRGHARRVSLFAEGGPLAIAAADPGPAEVAEAAEGMAHARSLVEQAKRAMTPVRRLAWRLRYEEGMDYAEIARVIDVPSGTIATWLHRSRQAILSAVE
jgi:RNA polymerase sigma-70 factor (ECF subfamily)